MFSFFRRSKKEPETKKNKDDKKAQNTTEQKDIGKNNPTQINATTSLPTELGRLENFASSEVTAVNEKSNDSNLTNCLTKDEIIMNNSDNSANNIPQVQPTITYSTFLRKPEKEVRSGVKPCGHGTLAVTPSIPTTGMKRENTGTPPSSPKFEIKKYIRKNSNLDRQSSSDSDKTVVKEDTFGTPPSSPAVAGAAADNLIESIRSNSVVNRTDNDADKKNLINQEAKFQSQLNDLSKELSTRDAEASKLRFQLEELQRDVFVKSAGMDRLEAELQAAHKESEIVRQRIKHLENDLAEFRHKNNKISEELSEKSENFANYESETSAKISELENVIKELQKKIEELENELERLKREKDELEIQRARLMQEREEEKQKVIEALEKANLQKQEIEQKWKEDFEKLRTINIIKEQQLLDDFEWKLREVQQSCKKRLQEKDRQIEERLQEAYREAEKKMKEADEMMAQVENMKTYQMEIEKLKDLTQDQERAMKEMIEQQEQMKQAEESLKNEAKRLRNLIAIEKENLQHIQLKHHQEIVDKERVLKQTLHQKRTEIAMYWEERLLNECGRLKYELEQIHNEEKHFAMETVRREKEEEFEKAKFEWENKIKECLKEITALKRALKDKDDYFREEMVRMQSDKDRDIMELRRLMDKIDMLHHDRFEKLVMDHDQELERINAETEKKIKEIEEGWQNQVTSLKSTLDLVKEEMERESQMKIESLIEQHRSELDAQWENLIHQKSEAVQLVENEYISKYKLLEEQFYAQQKSHEAREIELLKTIDSLKNELSSKDSSIDDLQNNVDTLEGGIQVLNQEIAQQGEQILKTKRDADQKIRGLQETITKLEEQQEKEREAFRLKYMSSQKQSQETIDHLHRKCQCLTKLFEEVRLRYERRESRQEDLNIISDLKQVIAEQEKDLACLNEEKRYFQMRLMSLENQMEGHNSEEEAFEDAEQLKNEEWSMQSPNFNLNLPASPLFSGPNTFSIPPTIPECDE